MSTVHELLDRLSEIGATIRPAGNHLILRAGSKPVPAELVKRIHEAKVEVFAALLPEANEARHWQERFTVLTFAWGAGKRDWEAAKCLAWGDLQNEWHKRHGRRWPAWQCVAKKVLERLATSDKTTIVIERQPDGKMRVASGSQVLEVRHAIRRRLATCGSQNLALRRLGPAL